MPNSKLYLRLLLALVVAEVLSSLELAMSLGALRYMIEDFGSPAAAGWTITCFLLSASVSAAIFGRLGDSFDRRKMLLLVICLSITGSLIAGATTNLAVVIIGRIIQGSAGAIFPLCVGILREHMPHERLPIYIGMLTAVLAVSGGLGLLAGGLLVDHLHWRWIFFTSAGFGLFALVLVAMWVPHGKATGSESGTNYLGGLLFVPGFVFLLLAINQADDWGFADIKFLGLTCTGLGLLIIWVRSELHAQKPLIQIRLLQNREMSLVILSAAIMGLTWNQFTQFWSLLLQQPLQTGSGLGLSASMSALLIQPQTFMALLGGPLAGWFVLRYGTRWGMVIGAIVLSSSWFVALLTELSIPLVLSLMFFMGVSSAFLYALMPTIIVNSVPASRTSEAIGMMTVIRSTMTGIGAQVVAILLSVSTVTVDGYEGRYPSPLAYSITTLYIAGGIFTVAVLYLVLSDSGKAVRDGEIGAAGG